METDEIIISWAVAEDAPAAAELMYEASFPVEQFIFGQSASQARELIIDTYSEVFPRPGHIQSYSHTFVAKINDSVVGMFLGFDRKTRKEAIRASYKILLSWLRRIPFWHILKLLRFAIETGRSSAPITEEDYYIEYFAVTPQRRLQGIGRRLMQTAEMEARRRGLKRIALDMVIDNKEARCFYEGLGFKVVNEVTYKKRYAKYGLSGETRIVKYLSH